MFSCRVVVIVSILLCVSGTCFGQQWSGIIDPSRAVDWSRAGVPGGIPNRTTQCGPTIAPYIGTAGTINNAIAACPAGQFVSLGSGTFALSSGISMKSGVVLRGQGANSTFLVLAGSAGCGYTAGVCLAPDTIPSPGDEKNVCDWMAGYSKGATNITLANCGTTSPARGSISNLKVGSLIILDQVDEATDNGQIWNCAVSGICGNTDPGGGQRTNGPTVSGIANRSQQQTVTVTSCDGNSTAGHACASGTNIAISPGLYMPNWRTGQKPQAWYANAYLTNAGLEDVSVDGSSVGANYNVVIGACSQCWVKGIRSMWASRSHITLDASAHCTIQDSYFYQSLTHQSVSYTVEIFWGGSDNLIQNNISQQVTDSMPNCNGGCEGNVFSYNFAIDDVWMQSLGWMQPSFYQHAAGDALNLWEGNIGPGYASDQVHGTHHFETLFRNRLVGNQAAGCGSAGVNTCSQQTIPVYLYSGSRYFNLVGNVLGQAGYHNTYASIGSATDSPNGNTSIYCLGASGNECNPYTPLNSYCLGASCTAHGDYDPQVSTYLMRWGNWDTVNNASRFLASEVPSALSLYANQVPGSQALPASFYLSSKPSWFGSIPYPPIGPDVTNGNVVGVGGHANANPAQNCYLKIMGGSVNGTGVALSFNAATCYGQLSSQLPAPPTNLNATVN